jgi:hypothetical protein
MHVDPSAISLHFTVGPVTVLVETATGTVEQRAESARKSLRRRGYDIGPVSHAGVAGYAGLARTVRAKKKGRRPAGPPVVQMYTIIGPYAVMVSVTQAQAGLAATLGQIGLYPAAPPVISPLVRIPAVDRYAVEEKITITRNWVKLTALVSPGAVTMSGDEFAMASLADLRSRIPDLEVDNWRPDVFLGGQPCIRDTFLRGGRRSSDPVRSEFWWAGVVNGRGIQLFVSGTKSIIGLDEAQPLRDLVVLLPPD